MTSFPTWFTFANLSWKSVCLCPFSSRVCTHLRLCPFSLSCRRYLSCSSNLMSTLLIWTFLVYPFTALKNIISTCCMWGFLLFSEWVLMFCYQRAMLEQQVRYFVSETHTFPVFRIVLRTTRRFRFLHQEMNLTMACKWRNTLSRANIVAETVLPDWQRSRRSKCYGPRARPKENQNSYQAPYASTK